jgi:hypothetical protein
MSCFFLSPDTCKKITSVISNFWWSGVADKRSIHWKKWDDLTLPKCHGGMGFKDVKNFNLSMLGKQGWRLVMNPDSLCAKVLKGKYFPHGNFMTAGKKKNSSHTWRAIVAGRKVRELGLIKRIGDGTSTNIWNDRWLPAGVGHKPVCKKDGAMATYVAELISDNGRTWNEALHSNLLPFDVEAAKKILLGRVQDDFWAWSRERHGLYSVRSAYQLLTETNAQERAFAGGQ